MERLIRTIVWFVLELPAKQPAVCSSAVNLVLLTGYFWTFRGSVWLCYFPHMLKIHPFFSRRSRYNLHHIVFDLGPGRDASLLFFLKYFGSAAVSG